VQFCAVEGDLCEVVVAERAALCMKELEDGGGWWSELACHWPGLTSRLSFWKLCARSTITYSVYLIFAMSHSSYSSGLFTGSFCLV
jgi:hypothetical protein